jgi:hypothetical protein
MGTIWFTQKLISGSLIDVEHLIALVDALTRAGRSLSVPMLAVTPRPAPPPAEA